MVSAVTLAACAGVSESSVGGELAPLAKTQLAPITRVELTPLPETAPLAKTGFPAQAITVLPPATRFPPATAKAHVALLLPLNSAAFGRAAEAVKQGFMAASAAQPGTLAVKVYASSDQADDIVAAYGQATQAGAQIVVGPLTKNGVAALAASNRVSVPTLALNLPEQDTGLPPQLYLFGLAADQEARQVARTAFGEGRRSAAVISSGNSLARRIQLAFVDEWQQLGGSIASENHFSGANAGEIRDALKKQSPEIIFLAMDGRDARLLRPYLNHDMPTYATSQIYAGNGSLQKYYDLNGIQFVDMPWLLQPDHLAVMIYPRPEGQPGAELERLYALGIDAWRLAGMLLSTPPGTPLSLDGVTGQLSLEGSHQFSRYGVLAEFRAGEAVLLER